jgi:hypothetical protein
MLCGVVLSLIVGGSTRVAVRIVLGTDLMIAPRLNLSVPLLRPVILTCVLIHDGVRGLFALLSQTIEFVGRAFVAHNHRRGLLHERCRKTKQARSDNNFIRFFKRAIPSDTVAVNAGTKDRAQIIDMKAIFRARDAQVLSSDAPVGDLNPAIRRATHYHRHLEFTASARSIFKK